MYPFYKHTDPSVYPPRAFLQPLSSNGIPSHCSAKNLCYVRMRKLGGDVCQQHVMLLTQVWLEMVLSCFPNRALALHKGRFALTCHICRISASKHRLQLQSRSSSPKKWLRNMLLTAVVQELRRIHHSSATSHSAMFILGVPFGL